MNLQPLTASAVDPCASASSVSIVIPTRNRCATLALCLNALPAGAREAPSLEVIVADDCSSDDTRKTVEEFRDASGWKVIYLRQERPMGANAARNAALDVAAGETIVFIDDDVLVTEGWLGKLLAGLSNECPVVSGPVQLTLEGPIVGRHREEISSYLSEILSPPHGRRGEIVPAACNMAAYRSVFDRARFDETVRPPVEENDWLERAGVQAGICPGCPRVAPQGTGRSESAPNPGRRLARGERRRLVASRPHQDSVRRAPRSRKTFAANFTPSFWARRIKRLLGRRGDRSRRIVSGSGSGGLGQTAPGAPELAMMNWR